MSVSWADKLEMAMEPFDLEELAEEIRKPRPDPEALQAAARVLEMLQELMDR